jgi:DNA topoisomerase-1
MVTQAIRRTAEEMAHTMSVCRQSYIHPGLLLACESGVLQKLLQKIDVAELADQAELTRDESLFLAILPDLPG